MADDPVMYAISSRRHTARALRIIASGIEQGAVPLTAKSEELLRQFFAECLPPAPADPPTPPPTGA